MRKWLVGLSALIAAVVMAFLVSPWPSVYVIRAVFDRGAAQASSRLEKLVPLTVATATVHYDPADTDAVMDIYRPQQKTMNAPTLVWVHGGGFVSGRRTDVANYLKILAGKGFTVVNVDYTIAPEAAYPMPIRQINAALAFLNREGGRLGVDATRIVVAGDSAGAQIAAQTAAIITNPDYARLVGVNPGAQPKQLVGALLFCGVYDASGLGGRGGILGWFVQSTAWAYSGRRDWREAEDFKTMSIMPHLKGGFPSSFISAGNADPLAPQSIELAAALEAKGTRVRTLFFPADHEPPLGHEYQFDLGGAAGQSALTQAVDWLNEL
jgi:acetyl esterase